MAEDKCFCWLDGVAEPRAKVIVAYLRFETFGVEFDQDLEQGEVEVLLFGRAEVLSDRLRRDVADMIIVDGEEGLPDRVEVRRELLLELGVELLHLPGHLLRLDGAGGERGRPAIGQVRFRCALLGPFLCAMDGAPTCRCVH